MTVMKMSHEQYVQNMVNEGETGNLKKLDLEVEHEIEREFIWIKCIEWNKMLHLNNTCVYAQYM